MKINVVGTAMGNSGYAIHTRKLTLALNEIADVALECTPQPGIEKHPINRLREKQYIEENTLMITYPDWFRMKFPERLPKLFGYGVFEGDKVPINWARNASDQRLDKLICPSEHTKQAFINSKVPKDKIEVIPHGVDSTVFKPKGDRIWEDEAFRFLFVGGWKDGVLDRKGFDIALRAFKGEFRGLGEDSVRFIGKINMAYGGNIVQGVEALNLPKGAPRIDIITDDLNEERLAKLYRSTDCFVMPTKAEAFCMPVAESLACGCPIIATDYGGHTEYSRGFGELVKAEWIPATGGPYYEGVRWKRIDFNGLKKAMRKAYEERDTFKKLGMKGSKFIRKSLTWNHTAKKVLNLFEVK
jgi:hypothetical protein